ncbi:MAG TPA: condensation domain-containing protein, partial [Longimicrobiales bacterium]|nr:condensation domain-containing protein [Longimicrobiales bacterium]
MGALAGLQAPPLVPIARDAELALSFAQQRLWFLDQMEPGSALYNIPAAVRLRGVLNVEALERTLSEVVRRHEVLRTHFAGVDGEPVQVIEPPQEVRLAVTDLSMLDEAERAAETQRLVAEESARPFDLANGPLLRMSLLRLGEAEHVALVTMHHIVSDGWSIGVLVREVAALYTAYVRGEESPLEELPIQYADFAHWQRNWLQGDVLAAQLDYWHDELAGAPAFIDLPIDKPRPPVQTFRGAHHPFQLSVELSAQLRDLSRRHGSTLFMTLLAAFDLLLCRYAGQEQVLVGSPIANRNRSETEGLIGFFVNTLVLRGDVRGNPSFRELLGRVRETALGAYAHQDLPFEKLVEELQPERDMSRSPLFQVMFVLQNAPGEAWVLEGLSLSGVESAGDTAKFELMLGLVEREGRIVGGMEYNRDLYESETIERLVASYERVLQAVVTDAEQRAWEIELLSENERRQIIHGWNETAAAYPRELLLSELFETQAACTPETVALRFEDTAHTYRELNERSNQLAHYLQRSGVGPDVLVGILMHRSVEMIVAVLGILKAGGAYVPLDPSYPRARLAFMVQDAGLRMLLTEEELLNEV